MSFQRLLLISAVALFGGSSSGWAQITTPTLTRDYVFPPLGLASSETASITVVNVATASTATTGTTTAATPSCSGTISFANASGAIGSPTSFTVTAQQFATATLSFASAGLTGDRGEILGKISLTTAAHTPCSLMFSLETYDSTSGATHAVLSSSQAVVGPILPIAVPEARGTSH
jgi:hypothetical protein